MDLRIREGRLRDVAAAVAETVVSHFGADEWEGADQEEREAVVDEVADNIQELLGLVVEPECEET